MYGDPKDKGKSVDIRNLQSGEIVRHNTDGVFMAVDINQIQICLKIKFK